jgi:hypothetical protein
MLSLNKFIEVCCDNRISLESLFILKNIQEIGEEEKKVAKIAAILQYLERKKMIDEDGKMTIRGEETLKYAFSEEVKQSTPSLEGITFTKKLYKSLRETLSKNTGQPQAILNIMGKKYYFLCSTRDLEVFLMRFRKEYPELYNEKEIERKLIRFVDVCSKKKEYPMLLQYYIIHKDRGSSLATAMENDNETNEVDEFKLVDSKKLF